MNWKKMLATATFIVTLPTAAFAHGELWYDASSRFGQLSGQKNANKAKIVVYPLMTTNFTSIKTQSLKSIKQTIISTNALSES